jgi:non-ribosomal peptide synthetase component E (peptide arylation enzyme)
MERVIKALHTEADGRRYREMGIWGDRSLTEIVDGWAAVQPDKLALSDSRAHWTYGELQENSRRLAQVLLELGIERGDPVVAQLPTCALLALIHLAANRIGAVMIAMPVRWRKAEMSALINQVGAEIMISLEHDGEIDLRALHEEVSAESPGLHKILYARNGRDDSLKAVVLAAEPLSVADELRLRVGADDPAHVMCSSGTTGVPKASLWSANDLIANLVHQAGAALELSSDDVAAAIAPAGQGSTGYMYPILGILLTGGTSHMLEHWTPQGALELIEKNSCTLATAIPTQMVMMLDLDLESADLKSFTRFSNAGAPLPQRIAEGIERRMGCRVQSIYGSTDGGVPTMTMISDPTVPRQTSVGRACAGEELEIRDPEGAALAQGETGEVCWRGANNSYGYLNQPDYDTLVWDEDNWYQSGDLGWIDEDGYLRIVGRVKDMILRGGMNIFPAEVEEVLIHHPKISTVAIVAVPDERLGEQACAAVVAAGDAPTLEELTSLLDERGLAKFKWPEYLVILDELPVNPGGKVDKKQLGQVVAELLG